MGGSRLFALSVKVELLPGFDLDDVDSSVTGNKIFSKRVNLLSSSFSLWILLKSNLLEIEFDLSS
jgi:hypothetical protein